MVTLSFQRLGLFASVAIWAAVLPAQESENVANSIARSLNPDVYMRMMMNPATMTNPVSTCIECHNGEDVARYSATFGPMLQMMSSRNWFNPNAYSRMMVPMMNPATYTQWYNALMKRYAVGMDAAPPASKAEDTEVQ